MPSKPLETLPTNMNIDLEGVAIKKFYNNHQSNHLEKAYPQCINFMNLVSNHFIYERIQIEYSSENVDGK
jgi:hypothetical protein